MHFYPSLTTGRIPSTYTLHTDVLLRDSQDNSTHHHPLDTQAVIFKEKRAASGGTQACNILHFRQMLY